MINSRERNLLFCLMEFAINRYLMSIVRVDGFEKSERHMYLCKVVCAYYLEIPVSSVDITDDLFDKIHEETRELTDYLDEIIDLPLDGARPDYSLLVPLFFDKFIEICERELIKHFQESRER